MKKKIPKNADSYRNKKTYFRFSVGIVLYEKVKNKVIAKYKDLV